MCAMNVLRSVITVVCCIALLTSSAPQQPTISFCELLRHPEKYNGQLVKVRATWVYGFEWSYLHCLDCDGRVWLNTSELDEQSEKTVKHAPKYAGIVNIDVEGVFQADGSFGHLGGYKYQLTAHTVANPAVIAKGLKGPEKDLELQRKFGCGGAKPR
jgi:hypothetical protein